MQLQNNKIIYYLNALGRLLLPSLYFRSKLQKKLAQIEHYEQRYIFERVNYYNKLTGSKSLSSKSIRLSDFNIPRKLKVYYFDCQEYLRYYSKRLRIHLLPGDITQVPDEPTILKSRPLTPGNQNSVLLKLNKVRHFISVKDKKPFSEKKNILIGRGVVKVSHRVRFFEMYFTHFMCNLGQINTEKNKHWIKDKLTIAAHLEFKFILCLEGYDVASNLKWVMSSNSLAVMPQPKYESWYMEGTLIPDYHYVHIKEDYSDLEERLNYYIEHSDKAVEIIKNANAFVSQFRNKEREDLISLMVLKKYFDKTGQLTIR